MTGGMLFDIVEIRKEPIMSDYLAYASIGGGGSWGRAETVEGAIAHFHRSLYDWKHLFDLDGKEVGVGIYDVDGHDKLTMGHRGVRDDETDEEIPLLRVEKFTVAFPEHKDLPAWDDYAYDDEDEDISYVLYRKLGDALKAQPIARNNARGQVWWGNITEADTDKFGNIDIVNTKRGRMHRVSVTGF